MKITFSTAVLAGFEPATSESLVRVLTTAPLSHSYGWHLFVCLFRKTVYSYVNDVCDCTLCIQIRIHESPSNDPAYNMQKADWGTTELLEVYNFACLFLSSNFILVEFLVTSDFCCCGLF